MKKQILFIFLLFLDITLVFAIDNQMVWSIDNLISIGGYAVTIYGNPKIITTDKGNALEFNANAVTAPGTNAGDRIQIKGNPLGTGNSEFTIEMIFKPYATATDFAPRIFHICRTDSMSGPRVMTMEIRSTNTWTTDLYNKSVTGTGMMGTTHYPTDQWMHLAMTYKNRVMTGYVNGVLDITQTGTAYTGLPATAEVSLGGRMNNVNYFKGAIRKLIFTPIALDPSQFTLEISTEIKEIDSENKILLQNCPNPVRDSSIISYTLPSTEQAKIEVFNSSGQKVQTLVNEVMSKGKKETIFVKGNLPAGIYFYTLTTGSGFNETRKMNVL
jgi:hypothetical protein